MHDIGHLIELAPEPNKETDWAIFQDLATDGFFGQPYVRVWREGDRVSFEDSLGFIHDAEFKIPKVTQSTDEAIAFAESAGYSTISIEMVDEGFCATLKSEGVVVKGISLSSRPAAVVAALANSKLKEN